MGKSEGQAGENILEERDWERISLEWGRVRIQREAYLELIFLGGKKIFFFIIQSAESKTISIRPLSGRITDNMILL